ncbi:ABC transporter ATP-binding protein [Paenibacillus thermoaerophilus]|uniref:ABC transporter ATP-binding protein n=1 Tax=Paenibacillus thermoaerophilus TaxID=1215385 RepID=A0ABW2V408_9BACL|nr:ABC transporter ATP-binding protein [Paenibacillus thermoaerophilus]TMV06700.1 ABC transporter ATP-binding protein [Paenibacillus thermoaerophilus]
MNAIETAAGTRKRGGRAGTDGERAGAGGGRTGTGEASGAVSPCFSVRSLGYVSGGKTILRDISFDVYPGERLGVIGPNGSGKSTLLRLLSGHEPPSNGTVELLGRPIREYPRKRLARMLAVLQQEALPPVAYRVRETVGMGRFPHQNWLGGSDAAGEFAIDHAIRRLHLEHLQDRPLEKLSGGERQRVALAKAMAQEPQFVLLDEPTTYLDYGHQLALMDSLLEWQAERRLTIAAVLHDLNLAALYCDRLLVLHRGEAVACGRPEEVLDGELLRRVYGMEADVFPHPHTGRPQVLLPRPGLHGRPGSPLASSSGPEGAANERGGEP